MSDVDLLIEPRDGGSQITVRATPRAKRNAICGIREGALLISVTEPPDDGAANAAIIAVLAKTLRLPKSSVEIRRGQTARTKTVWLDMGADELRSRLAE